MLTSIRRTFSSTGQRQRALCLRSPPLSLFSTSPRHSSSTSFLVRGVSGWNGGYSTWVLVFPLLKYANTKSVFRVCAAVRLCGSSTSQENTVGFVKIPHSIICAGYRSPVRWELRHEVKALSVLNSSSLCASHKFVAWKAGAYFAILSRQLGNHWSERSVWAMNGAMAHVVALCIHDDSLASGLLCKRARKGTCPPWWRPWASLISASYVEHIWLLAVFIP